MRAPKLRRALAAGLIGFGLLASAQELPPRVSWPEAGLMVGFPPPADKRITRETALGYPNSTWAYQHVRELFPTRAVSRGGPVRALPTRPVDFEPLQFDDGTGQTVTWPQFLEATYTDAVVVLHRGRVVEERYFNGMRPDSPHLMFSMTKSMVGLLAENLIAQGRLDENAPVTRYVPEFAGSAFEGATVRHLMDMRDGVRFIEDYTDPRADIARHAASWGWGALPAGVVAPRGVFEALPLLNERTGPPGGNFRYASAVTDALGWVLVRATNTSLARLLSEQVWQPIGAEHDASWQLDLGGQEIAAAGLNATARDLARVGELIRRNGRVGRTQVIAPEAFTSIRTGADFAASRAGMPPSRADWAYRSQFWVSPGTSGTLMLLGVGGQRVFINPEAELVVVKLSSHPNLSNAPYDRIHFNAFAAVAERLN